MQQEFLDFIGQETMALKESGLYKIERILTTPQKAIIKTLNHKPALNLCANNYLGLADDPAIIHAAQFALETYGYGMASVRFICGTQKIHLDLEKKLSEFLQTEASILYSSCFDANTGLFETLLGEEDAVISDALNHASIIDGIRLCKAKRYRYANNDMSDLEEKLKASQSMRFRLIVTDGIFSMDGLFANLPAICALAEKYHAIVMVDDSHAIGFIGENGRGSTEYWGVLDKVDIITGTLGKALGGASGGFTSGRKEIIEWLRQRSRPYLFSNSLAPHIVATSLKVLDIIKESSTSRVRLIENARYFRDGLKNLGYTLIEGQHPIIPIMLFDAKLATKLSDILLTEGVFVSAFSYPVVPMGKARIRTQMSSLFSQADLDLALEAFKKSGKKLSLI
jgi:glycine C-acetyltransferase